jgi:hypothetical protein
LLQKVDAFPHTPRLGREMANWNTLSKFKVLLLDTPKVVPLQTGQDHLNATGISGVLSTKTCRHRQSRRGGLDETCNTDQPNKTNKFMGKRRGLENTFENRYYGTTTKFLFSTMDSYNIVNIIIIIYYCAFTIELLVVLTWN